MADWKTVRYDTSYEEKIDREILPLCDALNAAGFATTASCCGHGRDWPHVWFEHSTDARIEAMARFVMARYRGDYQAFLPVFQKELLTEGYGWCLEIHLNNVYADTPIDIAMKEAQSAMSKVTEAVMEWRDQQSGDHAETRKAGISRKAWLIAGVLLYHFFWAGVIWLAAGYIWAWKIALMVR